MAFPPKPAKGKSTAKARAPKVADGPVMPAPYKPPTPAERLTSSIGYAANDAVMAHPQVQRLRKGIHRSMLKAAKGAGFQVPGGMTPGGGGMLRNVRSM